MMQTSTPSHDAALKCPEKPARGLDQDSEPSLAAIERILAFSRNLEVRTSALLEHVQYLKS